MPPEMRRECKQRRAALDCIGNVMQRACRNGGGALAACGPHPELARVSIGMFV